MEFFEEAALKLGTEELWEVGIVPDPHLVSLGCWKPLATYKIYFAEGMDLQQRAQLMADYFLQELEQLKKAGIR